MLKTTFRPRFNIILLLTGLLCFWGSQAMAQPGPLDTELTNPPPFIAELVETTELTQEQVEQMRSDGAGWGNVMIAVRLAERIAADSDGVLTFDAALANVLDARAEGKGFGQIAIENDLKLGHVVGNEDTPNATNPPPFIAELVEKTELTQEQVEQMRSDGAGWGNIMIAARLAERIAADSDGLLKFDEALANVLDARLEGEGFGQIAIENDLKLGRVVGKGNKIANAGPYVNIERSRAQERRQNIFRRLIHFLGFGKKERFEKPPKPEKPERPARPERPERPEKPEKPEKPERPERPEKPEKPEKPERGPRR